MEMTDVDPRNPKVPCAVEGCRQYAVHGQALCQTHLRFGQSTCIREGCNRRVLRRYTVCAKHLNEEDGVLSLRDLAEDLRSHPQGAAERLDRELVMLDRLRGHLLEAYTSQRKQRSDRAMTVNNFVRGWLRATEVAINVTKAQWVVEGASHAGTIELQRVLRELGLSGGDAETRRAEPVPEEQLRLLPSGMDPGPDSV